MPVSDIYIYIYIERERERESWASGIIAWHSTNLRFLQRGVLAMPKCQGAHSQIDRGPHEVARAEEHLDDG